MAADAPVLPGGGGGIDNIPLLGYLPELDNLPKFKYLSTDPALKFIKQLIGPNHNALQKGV